MPDRQRQRLCDQSAFAPEALTIWPHLTASLLTKSANCGWLSAPGTAPWLARGYFVSTVGLDEEMVRAYIRQQEGEDERIEQMKLNV